MTITAALPTVWSARILANLLNAHVFGAPSIVNREHEGEVSDYGQSVKIISVQPVAIKAYSKDTPIASPDALTDDDLQLDIDQAFYYNFAVDDIDVVQTRPKLMDEATRTAAWGLRDESDTFLSDAMISDATGYDPGSQTVSNASDAYDFLVDARVALDGTNTPSEGRWAVCPPDYYGVVLKDDRFTHATGKGDDILANGRVGRIAGFDLYTSNNITGGATVVVGHPMAHSFVEQLLKTEPYRPQNMFADALKGLYVFGSKTLYPDLLGSYAYTIS